MMEAPKGEEKLFTCKVCEKSFPSGPALGRHMRRHFSGVLKRKTKSAYGNKELDDLTPESEVKDVAISLLNLNKKLSSGQKELLKIAGNEKLEDLTPESKLEEVALALLDLKKSGYGKTELMEIYIPESETEAACKCLFLEKIHGTDPAKLVSKLEFIKKKRKMTQTDVSLTDLKRTMYECNMCHRTFGSQQALGGHLSGRKRGRSCLQKDIESTAVDGCFNCDGYILKSDVGWATRRRSGF